MNKPIINGTEVEIQQVLNSLTNQERKYVLGDITIPKPTLYLYVYKINNIPVGYIKLNTKKFFDGNGYVELAINPNYRNKGIAKILMNKMINDITTNYPDVTIYYNTDYSNIASQKFAEKYGFKLCDQDSKFKRYIYSKNINGACKDIATARQFVADVDKLAKKYDANYFIVTDGASGIHNNGNSAVRNARLAQIKWEKENNGDPNEDWSNNIKNGKYTESYINENNTSLYNELENIKTPQELHKWMRSNIKYKGPKSGENWWKLKTTKELLKIKEGNCADQTYFIREQLSKMGIKNNLWLLTISDTSATKEPKEAHVFCTYEQNGKIYWIETSIDTFNKIHGPFNNYEDFKTYLTNIYQSKVKSNTFDIWIGQVPKVPYGVTRAEFLIYSLEKYKVFHTALQSVKNNVRKNNESVIDLFNTAVYNEQNTENSDIEKYDPNFKSNKKLNLSSFKMINIKDDKSINDIINNFKSNDSKKYIKELKMYYKWYNSENNKSDRSMEFIIWLNNTELVAYVIIQKFNDGVNYLTPMVISPSFRGHGLSNQIMDILIKDYNVNELTVKSSNTVAINLYKKYGFTFTNKYKGDKNQLFMIRNHNNTNEGFVMENLLANKNNYNTPPTNESAINENYLFSKSDIWYNIEDFLNGNTNLIMIVGYSGSGKSTARRMLIENKPNDIWISVEMDLTLLQFKFKDEKLKKINPLGYKFLTSSIGKKYRIPWIDYMSAIRTNKKAYFDEFTRDFLNFIVKEASENKNNKYIVDGIWPILHGTGPEFFQDWCVLLKGTSYVTSVWRATGRSLSDKYDAVFLDRIFSFIYNLSPLQYKNLGDTIERSRKLYEKYFVFMHHTQGKSLDIGSTDRVNSLFESSISLINEGSKMSHNYTIQRIDSGIYNKYKSQCSDLKHIDYENDHAYIFLDKSEWVGLVAVDTTKGDGNNWITAIVVNPPYRGKRISYQLLDFAINQFGANALTVTKSNKTAIHTYEKIGFKIINQSQVDSGQDKRYIMKFTKYNSSTIQEGWRADLPTKSFGIPDQRKYPLHDKKHVQSAIKLFGHASEDKKKMLAKRINSAAKKYNIEIPKTTQCYKYLHSEQDIFDINNNNLLIFREDDNQPILIDISDINHWQIGQRPQIHSSIALSNYWDTLASATISEVDKAKANGEFNNESSITRYVFISPEELSESFIGIMEPICVGQITLYEDYRYSWDIQYPLLLNEADIIISNKESMSISSFNPIVGRPNYMLINTNYPDLVLTTDPESDIGMTINESGLLDIVYLSKDMPIYEAYSYIGPKDNLDFINELYKNNTVTEFSMYELLSNRKCLTEDQINYDPYFKRINFNEIAEKLETNMATLREQVISCMLNASVPIVENVKINTIPSYDEISILEDFDGYYYYSNITNKRSRSVNEKFLLTEDILHSVL